MHRPTALTIEETRLADTIVSGRRACLSVTPGHGKILSKIRRSVLKGITHIPSLMILTRKKALMTIFLSATGSKPNSRSNGILNNNQSFLFHGPQQGKQIAFTGLPVDVKFPEQGITDLPDHDRFLDEGPNPVPTGVQ
jgi:hypothetical protein